MMKMLVQMVQQLLDSSQRRSCWKTSSAQPLPQRSYLVSVMGSQIPPLEQPHFQMSPRIVAQKLKMSDLHCLLAQRVLARVLPAQIQLWSMSVVCPDLPVAMAKVSLWD